MSASGYHTPPFEMIRWLRNFLTSRYTLFLEEECIRLRREIEWQRGEIEKLRAENRGTVNTLLGVQGHPPMAEERKRDPVKVHGPRSLHQVQTATTRESLRKMVRRAEIVNGQAGELQPEAETASGAGEASGRVAS